VLLRTSFTPLFTWTFTHRYLAGKSIDKYPMCGANCGALERILLDCSLEADLVTTANYATSFEHFDRPEHLSGLLGM
jgi:hypothetical protein